MSQDTSRPIDLEKGGSQETVAGIIIFCLHLSLPSKVVDSLTPKADDHPERAQPEIPQTLEDLSRSEESSRKIYSVYSKIAEEEDNKMTERWQTSANGILIFVSSCIDIHATTHINRSNML